MGKKKVDENVLSYLLIKEEKVCVRSFDKTLIPVTTAILAIFFLSIPLHFYSIKKL